MRGETNHSHKSILVELGIIYYIFPEKSMGTFVELEEAAMPTWSGIRKKLEEVFRAKGARRARGGPFDMLAYRRPPPPRRLPPFFSMYRSSDSLLSEDCINCFSRSSKSVGSLSLVLEPL